MIHNDEVWVYYSGINTTHGGAMPPKHIVIGRASWRVDGFVSMDADADGGMIETVLLKPAGGRLIVNADASEGRLAVAVLDGHSCVLPGYEREDCQPVRTDSVRHRIQWKNRDRLETGTSLKLRFHLDRARLYSFRFASEDP